MTAVKLIHKWTSLDRHLICFVCRYCTKVSCNHMQHVLEVVRYKVCDGEFKDALQKLVHAIIVALGLRVVGLRMWVLTSLRSRQSRYNIGDRKRAAFVPWHLLLFLLLHCFDAFCLTKSVFPMQCLSTMPLCITASQLWPETSTNCQLNHLFLVYIGVLYFVSAIRKLIKTTLLKRKKNTNGQ